MPIQKQPGENYCVYTCLSAIAKSYNRTLTPEDAEKKAEQLFIGGDWGISTYDIPLLAISLGFDISLIQSNGEPKNAEQVTWDALSNGNLVLMVADFSPEEDASSNHATVIFRMDKVINSERSIIRTYVAEPAHAKTLTLSPGSLNRNYLFLFSISY